MEQQLSSIALQKRVSMHGGNDGDDDADGAVAGVAGGAADGAGYAAGGDGVGVMEVLRVVLGARARQSRKLEDRLETRTRLGCWVGREYDHPGACVTGRLGDYGTIRQIMLQVPTREAGGCALRVSD
jgi:hypothetical protein